MLKCNERLIRSAHIEENEAMRSDIEEKGGDAKRSFTFKIMVELKIETDFLSLDFKYVDTYIKFKYNKLITLTQSKRRQHLH